MAYTQAYMAVGKLKEVGFGSSAEKAWAFTLSH
jgi:hypothetical protein